MPPRRVRPWIAATARSRRSGFHLEQDDRSGNATTEPSRRIRQQRPLLPSASQRTGQVVHPGAHSPPSHPSSVNHPQPRHPCDHGCLPAPETHAPPKRRASHRQGRRPTIQHPHDQPRHRLWPYRHPNHRRSRQQPPCPEERQIGDQAALGRGKGGSRSGSSPQPAPLSATEGHP